MDFRRRGDLGTLIDWLRKRIDSENIKKDLPYLLSMMAAMSRSGMDITEIITALRNEETLSKSTRNLIWSLILGSTSRSLAEVLNEKSKEYSGTIRSLINGLAVETTKGNITPFLESFTSKMMAEKVSEERETTTPIQIMGTAYAALFVLAPMILIIIVSALGFYSSPMMPLPEWFNLLFLLYVPLGTVFFTAVGWERRMIRRAIPSIISSVIFLCFGLFLDLSLSRLLASVGLFVTKDMISDIFVSLAGLILLPLGIYEMRIWLTERSIDRNLTSFLEDYAFQLLTGRDFLQTFKILAKKQYGKLTQHLQKVVNSLEIGEPFTESVKLLMHETDLSMRVTTLLSLLMKKGGDISKIVESVSSFSWSLHQIELEKERKQYFTVAFFYVFMSVFLFLTTSTLQILATTNPIAGNVGLTVPMMARMLFEGAVVLSICTGLVAGSLSTGKMGVGGIHSFIFTALSMLFHFYVWQ